jgi:hypothetical protein
MADITWDFSAAALASALGKIQKDVQDALPGILEQQAKLVQSAWQAGADGKMYPGMFRPFHSKRYQQDIITSAVHPVQGGYIVTISSTGQVPGPGGKTFDLVKDIEDGKPSRDMKPAILRSGSARTTKEGVHYVIIPFRHGSGESVHFKSNIGPTAKKVVRERGELSESTWSPAGGLSPFAKLMREKEVMGPKRAKVIVGSGGTTRSYTWQRRQFAGLRNYGAARHSQYMTFRTVSDRSDPNSWIYPAMPANPIFRSMATAMEPIVRKNVEDSIRRL